MSDEPKDKMKPVIILPPDEMHSDSIKMLRDNGFCVVTAKHPDNVRFMDAPPSQNYDRHEQAAIWLSRYLLAPRCRGNSWTQKDIAAAFIELLITGTSLDENHVDAVKRLPSVKQELQKMESELENLRRERRKLLNSVGPKTAKQSPPPSQEGESKP